MAIKSAKSNNKRVAKSSATKSTAKKTTVVKKESTPEVNSTPKTTTLRINKSKVAKVLAWVFVVLVGILLIDLIVQLYYLTPAAIVNGERISYTELDKRLRESYGEETLENLINEEVVLDQAAKQNIKINDKQINDEYKNYVESFPGGEEQLLEQLDEQHIDKTELLRRIQITLMVNQLVKDRVKDPTEEEVKEYYDLKYSYLEEANRPKYEDVKEEVKKELKQTNLQDEVPEWLDEVKSKGDIQNNLADDNAPTVLGFTQGLLKRFLNAIGAEALSNSLFGK